jgi:hypothetical protein
MGRIFRSLVASVVALAVTGAGAQSLPASGAFAPPPQGGMPPGPPPGSPPPQGGLPPGPPPGTPPGKPPGPPLGPPPGQQQSVVQKGDVAFTGGTHETTGEVYRSTQGNVSALLASDGATVLLKAPTLSKSGNSSSPDNSSFFGQNAALLATLGSQVQVENGRIVGRGVGANGVASIGSGTLVTLRSTRIQASLRGAHGVDAAAGGRMILVDDQIDTRDENAAAVATDRGGGVIEVTGGSFTTSGYRSPVLYSTGTIDVTGLHGVANDAEAAVIEGSNTIKLRSSVLTGRRNWGVMMYQSFSGDAQGQESSFSMTGGSLTADQGPLLYVNNTRATITLDRVALSAPSGTLLKAAAGQWGTTGKNGGHVVLLATHQTLHGDVSVDAASSAALTLREHSVLMGKVTGASVTLADNCQWDVTGDSSVNGLVIAGADPKGFIHSHGHAITYRANLPDNAWLQGKTWPLDAGGVLKPGAS